MAVARSVFLPMTQHWDAFSSCFDEPHRVWCLRPSLPLLLNSGRNHSGLCQGCVRVATLRQVQLGDPLSSKSAVKREDDARETAPMPGHGRRHLKTVPQAAVRCTALGWIVVTSPDLLVVVLRRCILTIPIGVGLHLVGATVVRQVDFSSSHSQIPLWHVSGKLDNRSGDIGALWSDRWWRKTHMPWSTSAPEYLRNFSVRQYLSHCPHRGDWHPVPNALRENCLEEGVGDHPGQHSARKLGDVLDFSRSACQTFPPPLGFIRTTSDRVAHVTQRAEGQWPCSVEKRRDLAVERAVTLLFRKGEDKTRESQRTPQTETPDPCRGCISHLKVSLWCTMKVQYCESHGVLIKNAGSGSSGCISVMSSRSASAARTSGP